MFVLSAVAVALAALSPALAQTDFSSAHNVTSIAGTWSSGSKQVVTGSVSVLTADQTPANSLFSGLRSTRQLDFHVSQRNGCLVRLVSLVDCLFSFSLPDSPSALMMGGTRRLAIGSTVTVRRHLSSSSRLLPLLALPTHALHQVSCWTLLAMLRPTSIPCPSRLAGDRASPLHAGTFDPEIEDGRSSRPNTSRSLF